MLGLYYKFSLGLATGNIVLLYFSLSISVYTNSWLLEEKVSNFRQRVEMLTFAHVSDSSK